MKDWKLDRVITTPEAFGYMWECPDYFELDGQKFLSVSPQGLKREEYRFQNIYQSGYFPVKEDESVDTEDFREWDMGFDFYAPQTFVDDKGRRILIGWMGMPDADYRNPTAELGWQHCLTVPREVELRDGKLYQRPVSFSCGVYVIRNDADMEEHEPQPTSGTGKNINESMSFVSRYLLYAETAEASIASGGYRSQFLIYNELIGARQLKANDIENRMVNALEHGEFTVFMQPQVCLADRKLLGAEALIRWQGPDGKMVYPDEFIPLFEQNGFIRELDLFVLDTVCAWIRRRLDEGKKVPPISINQSKALFFHDNYVETVLGIAARHDVPAHLLHVEVTESMAWLDEEAFIRTLDALRRAGIGLSLDDFGKGYSSMAMLHSFGFDTIKLDRAFLAPGQEKQRSVWIIISSLVDMARRLGIEILCEGVETEDQLQKLLASHCKYGQGYLFSPPMDLETFDAYVDAHELERK